MYSFVDVDYNQQSTHLVEYGSYKAAVQDIWVSVQPLTNVYNGHELFVRYLALFFYCRLQRQAFSYCAISVEGF